jgi:cation:H+ antiporter
MTPALASPLFVLSLVVTLAAAAVFAGRLDRVGVQLGMPEALLGLLTAVAADGPEIAAAVAALVSGARGVSLGVVAGSNIFNLAAMIGLGALLAGRVHLPRAALVLEGTVAGLCTLSAVALILGLMSAPIACLLFAVVLVPYTVLLVRGPGAVRRLALPKRFARHLAHALAEREHPPTRVGSELEEARSHALPMLAAVALIVAGSVGMVQTALTLADAWHVPRTLVGVLVLAPLTSIPNAYTGVRLGLGHRGSALVSETLNSNTINLAGGVVVPGLFVSLGAVSTSVRIDVAWLLATTVAALLLLGGRRGMSRAGGASIVSLYLVFVAVQAIYP